MSTVLGFLGNGESSDANTKDLLDDFVSGLKDVELVFPLDKNTENQSLAYVLEWSDGPGFPLTVLASDEAVATNETVASVFNDETVIGLSRPDNSNLYEDVINEIRREDSKYLIVFAGETANEETLAAIELALSDEISVLDITAGLDVFQPGDVVPLSPEVKPTRKASKAEELIVEEEEITEEPEEKPKRGRPRKASQEPVEPSQEEGEAQASPEVLASLNFDEPEKPVHPPTKIAGVLNYPADGGEVYAQISEAHLLLSKLYKVLAS